MRSEREGKGGRRGGRVNYNRGQATQLQREEPAEAEPLRLTGLAADKRISFSAR
jgi:hypothetical protein